MLLKEIQTTQTSQSKLCRRSVTKSWNNGTQTAITHISHSGRLIQEDTAAIPERYYGASKDGCTIWDISLSEDIPCERIGKV